MADGRLGLPALVGEALARQEIGLKTPDRVAAGEKLGGLSGASRMVGEAIARPGH